MLHPRLRRLLPYTITPLVAAAVLVVTRDIPAFRERVALFLFVPAVLWASLAGGLGPGLFATVVATLAAAYVLMTPPYGPVTDRVELALLVVIFPLVGTALAWVAAERRRTEERLRASEELNRAVLGSLASHIAVLDRSGIIVAVNEAWRRFAAGHGGERAGLGTGANYLEVCARAAGPADGDAALTRAGLGEVLSGARESFTLDYACPSAEHVRWFQLIATQLSGPGGGAVVAHIDITERKRAERERTELYEEAKAANRTKDEFLAMVSHELRSPLSPILTWAHLLRSGRLGEEQRRRAIEAIDESGRSLKQLIDDLLDVSRIISGKFRAHMRPVVMRAVVEATVESMRPAAAAKGVRLEVVEDESVPLVSGDDGRLKQVMWNLVSNAVKFTDSGGRVTVELTRSEADVVIRVRDTGRGIAPETVPRVFERFWQADSSATRKHGGLGLGLAIVRHLVELHGGTVGAESAGQGRGATFIVTLPALVSPAAADDAAREEPAPDDALPSLAGVRVLLVDDDAGSNEAVRIFLGSRGAETRTADTAGQALDLVDGWWPDVLVSDIAMPDEDGYALVEKMRAQAARRARRLGAVALTALARQEDRVRALSAGFQAHLAKPVEPGELLAVVAGLARRTG